MSENKGIFNFKKLNIKNKNELSKDDEIVNNESDSKKSKANTKKIIDAEKSNSKKDEGKSLSENSKADKKERIIKEGYNLFTNKGIVKTSIQA